MIVFWFEVFIAGCCSHERVVCQGCVTAQWTAWGGEGGYTTVGHSSWDADLSQGKATVLIPCIGCRRKSVEQSVHVAFRVRRCEIEMQCVNWIVSNA